MQIKIKCPNNDCGKTLVVDTEMAGKKGKCSTCDSVFLIPGAPSSSKQQPGGSTVNLPTSNSGELSAERKKASSSGSHKSSQRKKRPKSGETKNSSEKYLDDYIEESPPKRSRPRREELDDYSDEESDYVEYDDYEEERSPRRRGRPRRQERSGRRDDFYDDDDDYDDYPEDDYDDYPPRRGRGRDDFYEEDDYYEDQYEDSYGPPAPTVGRRGRSKRSGPNLGLIRAGLMILAIAGFVFCGAVGIKILVELIGRLGSGMGDTSMALWKIAELLWLGAAIAVIVGYSFLLFFPNKHNARGLTIAALVIGAINIIVQIVIKILPLFDGRSAMSFLVSIGSVVEGLLKMGLVEALFIAEIVLVALSVMAINKQLKDRYNMQMAKQMIIPAGIYGGILIVIGMFILIVTESTITSRTAYKIWEWVIYLLRVGSQGMLIWYFVNYIMLMFNTRNAMPKS